MASIYKRTRLKAVPDGAEIVERKGRKFAEWMNRKTKRLQRAALSDDGQKIVVEGDTYLISYFDHENRRIEKSSGTSDKNAAQRLAGEWEKQAMLRRAGLIDPAQDRYAAQGRRRLAEHLADYKAVLIARGNTAGHCSDVESKVRRLLDVCRVEYLQDLTASAVQAGLQVFMDQDRGLKTLNHYVRSIKGVFALDGGRQAMSG